MEAIVAAKPTIKVAAIGGSIRKGSFNRSLLFASKEMCKESIPGMEIEYVDISALPFMNTDLEAFGEDKSKFAPRSYPPAVEAFRAKVREADSILFASPEYNYSVTPILKNALDWGSRPPKDIWTDKAAAIISAGGQWGGGRSQYHLRQIGVYLDLHFINKPEFFLLAHQPPPKFSSDGKLIDEDARKRLKEVLLSLQAFTLRLKGKDATNGFKEVGHNELARDMMNVGEIDSPTVPLKCQYIPTLQAPYNPDETSEIVIKIQQFLVPLLVLGLAFGVWCLFVSGLHIGDHQYR